MLLRREFYLFQGVFFTVRVKGGTDGATRYVLTGGDVRRTTNDL